MKEKQEKLSCDDLRFVRIFDAGLIPRHLIDNIKCKEYTTDDFFKYQQMHCLFLGDDGQMKLNPLNHLYALVDKNNLVRGATWLTISDLEKNLNINTFSIDKEYWSADGKAIEKLSNFVKDIIIKAKLKKIYWCTNKPKSSERHGFKRSRQILMEFDTQKELKKTNGATIKIKRQTEETQEEIIKKEEV